MIGVFSVMGCLALGRLVMGHFVCLEKKKDHKCETKVYFLFCLPHKHIVETPFFRFREITVFVSIQYPRPTLEWSLIQVQTMAQVA